MIIKAQLKGTDKIVKVTPIHLYNINGEFMETRYKDLDKDKKDTFYFKNQLTIFK